MLLYAQLVFTLASYMRRRVDIKIIKIMKINIFHCTRLCETSLYVSDSVDANGVTFQ